MSGAALAEKILKCHDIYIIIATDKAHLTFKCNVFDIQIRVVTIYRYDTWRYNTSMPCIKYRYLSYKQGTFILAQSTFSHNPRLCISANACILVQTHTSGLDIRTARSIKDTRDCWSNSRVLCEKFPAHTSEAHAHTHLKRTHTHIWSARTHTSEALAHTHLKRSHTHIWSACTHTHVWSARTHTRLKRAHTHASEAHAHASEVHAHASEVHAHASEAHAHASEAHAHASEAHAHASEAHAHASEAHAHTQPRLHRANTELSSACVCMDELIQTKLHQNACFG